MTIDEVMALTDEDLRINAARLMGFVMFELMPNADGENAWLGFREPGGWQVVPCYPNDIEVAMDLVDVLSQRETGMIIYSPCRRFDTWRVQYDESDNRIVAGTAERAITRAFLMAMEGDEAT